MSKQYVDSWTSRYKVGDDFVSESGMKKIEEMPMLDPVRSNLAG